MANILNMKLQVLAYDCVAEALSTLSTARPQQGARHKVMVKIKAEGAHAAGSEDGVKLSGKVKLDIISSKESVSARVQQCDNNGVKVFVCLVCDKVCRWRAHCEQHVREVHDKMRPYKCAMCGQTFTQSGNLTNHKRTHTGEKPYECTVCGQTFTRSDALSSHKRTHTGEKPYECTVCGQTFTQSGALTRHVRAVHDCQTT